MDSLRGVEIKARTQYTLSNHSIAELYPGHVFADCIIFPGPS